MSTSTRKKSTVCRIIGAACCLAVAGGIFAQPALSGYRTHWTWGSYVEPGSLCSHTIAELAARNSRPSGYLFTATPTQNTVSNAVRNTNFWLADVRGISAFSACRDTADYYDVPATLITRRHIYMRGHSMGVDGYERKVLTNIPAYFWIGTNNSVWRGVCTNAMGTLTNGYDYTIGILTNDAPAHIEALRFVTNAFGEPPAYTNSYFQDGLIYYPFVRFCQHRLMGARNAEMRITIPDGSHDFRVGGDSGSPVGFVVEGEFVMHGGETTTGYSAHLQQTVDLLTMAAGLDTNNYQVQVRSLTNYPTYP